MFSLLLFLIILWIAVAAGSYFISKNKLNKTWNEFANKASYTKSEIPNLDNFPGIIRPGTADTERMIPIIALINKTTQMYLIDYVVEINDRHYRRPYTVLVHDIPSTKQHVFIRSEVSRQFNKVNPKLNPTEKYEAEGDMSKYFDFYFPDKSETSSLQILDPTVMMYILENMVNVDIEIIDDKLIIYYPDKIASLERLTRLNDKAEVLAKKINTSGKSMMLVSGEKRGSGSQLSRGKTPVIAVIMFGLFMFFIFGAPQLFKNGDDKSLFIFTLFLAFAPLLLGVALFVFIISKVFKNKRLTSEHKKRYGESALI